jgi:hypothetical protein
MVSPEDIGRTAELFELGPRLAIQLSQLSLGQLGHAQQRAENDGRRAQRLCTAW